MTRSFRPVALAAAAYICLTVALTWPLAVQPASLVPSDLGDPLLNTWIMWWNAEAIPLTARWWNAPMFVPIEGALGFSEHLLGLSPITTPIILATGDALLAYNAAFLLAFPLCALSAHFLVFTITRRHDVAFIGGLAFAFSPYRMPQVAHVQVLSAYWMPLALAALHRYFGSEGPRTRWLVLFAASWLMQALACGYYFFFLSVLVALWLAWFALFRGRSREVASVLAAWVAAAVLIAPVLYGYWRISRTYNLRRSIVEIRVFSADIASLLKAPDISLAWRWLDVVQRPEAELFPGLTVLLLSTVAVILAWRVAARDGVGHRRAARVLLGLAALAAAVSIARILHGPFRIEIAGLRLLSVTSPEKPISVAALCLTGTALLHPAVRSAWRRGSSLAFYALATVAMWLMCLGPSPTLLQKPALYKAPYAWLLMLPGVDGVRVPARFWMLGVLCLAVTAALGYRLISQRWPRAARALAAAAVAGILIDGWPRPLPMAPRPEARPRHTEADLRLDLPIGPSFDTLALYRAIEHRQPLINGYSGYFAPHYWAMTRLLAEHNPDVVTRLAEFGSIEVMVDHEQDADGRWGRVAAAIPQARRVHGSGAYTTYLVPRRTDTTAVASGAPLPFTVSAASVNADLGPAVHDASLYTRWHAGREQRRGDWLQIDLGAERDVTGLDLLLGGYVADYPRDLSVETSIDAQSWDHAWQGVGGLLALSGALRQPREVPLSIPIQPRPARYVRLSQSGAELVNYWSIAELRVFGR